MNILGINAEFHDTSACLVVDGKVVVAIEEERLSRKKHSQDFPMRSIRYCLNVAGITMEDVDYIVEDMYIVDNKHEEQWRELVCYYDERFKKKIIKLRHHLGHAAAVYYTSGFKDAAILTSDGGGSLGVYPELVGNERLRERQVFWKGYGKEILELSMFGSPEYNNERPFPRSIGHVYEDVSEALGYGPLEGPGKIMGLASYGTGTLKRDMSENYIQYPNGHILNMNREFQFEEYHRKKDEKITQKHAELAYMIQKETEESLIRMANYLYKVTGSKNLCLGGGVALNCVANRKILDETPFENIFIFPASADAGLCVGNALYVYHQLSNEKYIPKRLDSPYLGRTYSTETIESAIKKFETEIDVQVLSESEMIEQTAKAIQDGNIIGWFQGGSEMGPRSLGHRSILANPCIPEMKDTLNYRVKHREPFRPFAPSVLKEAESQYFDTEKESAYMLLVANVLEEKKDVIPSVTHVDGTARLQTVTKEENGVYYKLIKKFGELTGVPVILNTSFNVAGEPIVEKPKDAIKCFLGTDIDLLVVGNYIIKKR